MISKELLSIVLGVVVLDRRVVGNEIAYNAKDNYPTQAINLCELAKECKKWALTKGYIVDERGVNIFVLTSDGIDVVWSSYGEPFCPHRVFEPCEWIMEIALRAHRKTERLRSLKDPIDNRMIKIDLKKFTKETLKKTKEKEIDAQKVWYENEIARLKKYIKEKDPLSLFKLALNETVKEIVVKPLVKDLIDKKMVKTEDEI